LAVNSELVRLYWDIGNLVNERQQQQGWGAAVIPKLAAELKNELPDLKGFSERNIGHMIAFAKEYPSPNTILQHPVAKLEKAPKSSKSSAKIDTSLISQPPVALLSDSILRSIPWAHHITLLQKIKDISARRWYMEQTIANGWSRNILALQIDGQAHLRQGKATSNFAELLPSAQSDLLQQTLKDPYIFDFITLAEPFQERELETELVKHVQKFLIELSQGFAFVGRQYRIDVGGDDFDIDLLFYHLKL
jgi:predicted nuclease of restriction endonuclease-like (RecB) superfamily